MEDEIPWAHALELKLTHAGFEAKAVFNGEDGLELIKKEKFALILLDLMMPKMDGFEVLKVLQKKNIEIPVIVLSNLRQEEDVKRVKTLGAKDFILKSDTSLPAIVELVAKLLA